jgi:hypothetical protein
MRYLDIPLFLILVIACLGCQREEIKIISPPEASSPQGVIEEEKVSKTSPVSIAVSQKNPFLTSEEEVFFKDKDNRVVINYLDLSAIFYSPPKSYAIINGQIFKEGDIVDNKRIEKIEPERVVLKAATGEYLLNLKEILEE